MRDMHTRTVTVTVEVGNVPDVVADDEVAGYVNTMLEIGYADACDTADDPNTDPEAREDWAVIVGLDFGRAMST